MRDELGNPLPQANVSLVGTRTVVVGNDQGQYSIRASPAGTPVLVRWSYSGLVAKEQSVLVEAGETVVLDIGLKLTTLPEATIRSTRRATEEGLEPLGPPDRPLRTQRTRWCGSLVERPIGCGDAQ